MDIRVVRQTVFCLGSGPVGADELAIVFVARMRERCLCGNAEEAPGAGLLRAYALFVLAGNRIPMALPRGDATTNASMGLSGCVRDAAL